MADGPEDDLLADSPAREARFSAVDLGALIQAIGYDGQELSEPASFTTEDSDIL